MAFTIGLRQVLLWLSDSIESRLIMCSACFLSMIRRLETIKHIASKDVTYHIILWAPWTYVVVELWFLPSGTLTYLHLALLKLSVASCVALCRSCPDSSIISTLKYQPNSVSSAVLGSEALQPIPRLVPSLLASAQSQNMTRAISQKIKGAYLEPDKRPDCHLLPTNYGGGEALSYSAEASVAEDPNIIDHEDLEHGIPGSGIRKIIRIATSRF